MPFGHSVFADSANNGPVGEALIMELIPAIEERFRIIAEPSAQFVGGHSSGGWSSLWLQVTYPDYFGGCWSTGPGSGGLSGISNYEPLRGPQRALDTVRTTATSRALAT